MGDLLGSLRALVLDRPHTVPSLEPVTVGEPNDGEVRVRIVASGI
jgi:Zn-dependent alcohol dehydrogenase